MQAFSRVIWRSPHHIGLGTDHVLTRHGSQPIWQVPLSVAVQASRQRQAFLLITVGVETRAPRALMGCYVRPLHAYLRFPDSCLWNPTHVTLHRPLLFRPGSADHPCNLSQHCQEGVKTSNILSLQALQKITRHTSTF